VDIRLREQLSTGWLQNLESKDFGGFQKAQPMKQGSFRFEIPKDQPARAAVASEESIGWRYDKADGSQVLQVRRNGMTLSILKNYTNWQALSTTVRDAWERYLEISGPIAVSRLAVRYINGIEIRLGRDYDEYLTAGPRIPQPLPQIVNNFIQRVEIPFASDEATAIITQTTEPPVDGKGYAVLDIDVYSSCSLQGDSPELWSVLERLRIIANNIFFSSITKELLDWYR
jgi:uncharacterized protein (TIGR04255 family)